jgi:hypothetical protein
MATMAGISIVNRWHGHETSRAAYKRALEDGNTEAQKMLETMVLGLPHFEVRGTTDTNTADSDAINLSDLGVVFGDAKQVNLYVEASVADDNGQGLLICRASIDGGSTPIVSDESVDGTLDDGLAGAPSIDFEVVSDEVIIEAVGVLDVDLRWVIKIWVSDPIPLAYIPTT